MVEKVLHTVLYLRRTEMEFKKKKKKLYKRPGLAIEQQSCLLVYQERR